ncbi:helix-hairpin-helix domain-containing protein [uncultured Enorma sp.]|uniref:helix-hairpin-helix domain-containing protein n=1 Tax=uncultured Enorma sp. TaxID=1714346 RepID=UPI002804512C|nr:helix-hairpin-helix domain-containing protein [uncultured Enorma sp.]
MAQLQREHGVARVARRIRGVSKAGTGARIALACTLLGVAAAFSLGVIGAAREPVLIERAATSETQHTEVEGDDASVEREEAGADAGVEGDEIETVVVDVGGAVIEPGVVELDAGSRVADAIEAAGGLATDADCTTLNQAQLLQDGQKVYVPKEGEIDASGALVDSSTQEAGQVATALVNINTATLEELDALPGVGPATAQAIIDDREANGPFASVEDIMRVSGIGEKKYEKLKGSICI